MSLLCPRRYRGIGLVTLAMVLAARLAFAQADSTFNGRIVDQADALLPGVTITTTNTSTGVTRTTVTNADGIYSVPGLAPGIYDVKAELTGFAPATRLRANLAVGATITLDFKLGLAAVSETVTVSGAAPLIEATQSKVGATMQASEVENLPVITRSYIGLVALLPGARPVNTGVAYKDNSEMGGVSFGGSGGRNVTANVDGADNRDPYPGGLLMNFTQESIEEFRVSTHQFTAADGRTSGAVVAMVTKSGTNAFHGSAFVFNRNKALIANNYFAKRDNLPKPAFSRQQYGGSFGGPIRKNRIFFFGAAEGTNEDTSTSVPEELYNEFQLLLPYGSKPAHAIPRPFYDAKYTVKANAEVSPTQSLLVRYAAQKTQKSNHKQTERNDLSVPHRLRMDLWSAVVQHSWVLGSRALNQVTVHFNRGRHWDESVFPDGTPYFENFFENFPNIPLGQPSLIFPSVTMRLGGGTRGGSTLLPEIRNDVSLQLGTHALKLGAGYARFGDLGVETSTSIFGAFTFFDDPSVIASNRNGRYPQGFQTPGIVRDLTQANLAVGSTKPDGAAQFMTWIQDDWRIKPRLTLNLGVRYDLDLNLYNQRHFDQNATYQVLAGMGNPYGALPKTPTRDISPRVGFAYDLRGDGRRVLRGGYGMYYEYFYNSAGYSQSLQTARPLLANVSRTNTAIGVGPLATYRFGIDPQPPPPVGSNTLPSGATGQWFDPALSDPYNHQVHVGYAHELAPKTTLSVDFTRIVGRNELRDRNINPIVNGVRVLAPAFAQVYGNANLLGAVQIQGSVNQSRHDEFVLLFQRRFSRATFQTHYAFSGSYAYGGDIGGNSARAPQAQDQFDLFGPGEWGPTFADERHRLVAFGVFDLPYGIQLAPILQVASARPYNLTNGSDLNRDGVNNDRYVDPATGQQVSVNSQRGDPTRVVDLRVTKFLPFGTTRRIGVFVEVFNVFNTANFGNSYQGNARSAVFKQPIGFLPSIGGPRQGQLGARFQF